jgi:hypothetical protein
MPARHGAGVVDDRIQIVLRASILVACMQLSGDQACKSYSACTRTRRKQHGVLWHDRLFQHCCSPPTPASSLAKAPRRSPLSGNATFVVSFSRTVPAAQHVCSFKGCT